MNKISPQVLKYIFVSVASLEIVGHAFQFPEINQFTKPLLMPVLLLYFRNSLKSDVNLAFFIAMIALVFSWAGDVLLMYQASGEIYFMLGLGAFSITQILYIIAFRKSTHEGQVSLTSFQRIVYLIPFIIFGAVLLNQLWPNAGELKLPLTVYASLLIAMVYSSILRTGSTNVKSHNQVFFGALLFLFSDSLIAINKFLYPMDNPNLFIMMTYILAQWNIVKGLLLHYNEGHS